MKKYDKNFIDQLACNIMGELEERSLAGDVCIYVNNIRYSSKRVSDNMFGQPLYRFTQDKGEYNPLDYFEYAARKHILSMSFEGDLYDHINFGKPSWLDTLLQNYGLYYEQGNAWNLTVYCTYDEDYDKWEYTDYSSQMKPEPVHLYRGAGCSVWNNYPILKAVSDLWYELSKETGDIGGCVLGAHMSFSLNGEDFEMSPASPWQGENSWTPHVPTIKQILEHIGCINIVWHCGRLD